MNSVMLKLNKEIIELEGTINFHNVVSVCQQGLDLIHTLKQIKIDLKKLLQSDSSGLALFSAWVRAARQQNKAIHFMNMPSFMQDISKVCGLDGVLPIIWEN